MQLTQWLCFPVSRLEERESEMKKEYNALHQRHTEVGASGQPAGQSRYQLLRLHLAFTTGLWSLLLLSTLVP